MMALFIDGPADGQIRDVDGRNEVEIAEKIEIQPAYRWDFEAVFDLAQTKRVLYTRRPFRCDDRSFDFFAPKTTSDAECMDMMMTSYAEAARARKRR